MYMDIKKKYKDKACPNCYRLMMDRQHLYRGKRADNGEWVMGYLYRLSEKLNPFIMLINKSGESYEVIPETVGEYTGLDTDEETTQIFQDDIIKFDDGNVCFVGRVDKECGAWGIVTNNNIPLNYKNACNNDNFISFWEIIWNEENPDLILDDIVPYVRVIGNIHDNPELLEVSE